MATVVPSGGVLGATIEGIDLASPLSDEDFALVWRSLAEHSVLRFPDQVLDDEQLRDFSAQFGELDTSGTEYATYRGGVPEVGSLTNIHGDVSPGQGWHTDMSYMPQVAFANVLYALEVPVRDGKALGPTEFQNMYMAYEGLPPDFKEEFRSATCTFDFEKFNTYMIQEKGSTRGQMTAEQRTARAPASHPMFLKHPVSGRLVLYANPGYAVRVDRVGEERSAEILRFLFAHQLQEKYRYRFTWTVGDLLIWDDLATIHRAVDDYLPTERRHMKRCRVKADPQVAQVPLGTKELL